jgi:plastocyanin
MRAAATVLVLAAAFTVATPGVSTASGHARQPTVTIRMGDFFYRPAHATVHVGQKVRFVNVGRIAHTVADADAKGNVRSKLIKPRALERGQSQTVRFTRPGLVRYLCTFHPTLMRGTIKVVR